jgi:hypothetical protein
MHYTKYYSLYLLLIMQKGTLHKKILTAVILTLYVFITVPTALWHKHQHTTFYKQQTTVNKKVVATSSVVESLADINTEDHCNICDHQYSMIDTAHAIHFHLHKKVTYSVFNTIIPSYIISNVSYYLALRGPPSQA